MKDRKKAIQNSYRELGDIGTVYDGIITRSTLIGKIIDSVIWGLDKTLAEKWINDALDPIPEDFSGRLLEVPVGTGVPTMPMYALLPDADITCLDNSEDMMQNAQKRAEAMNLSNITFVQGDVEALPFADEQFDIVLSLNGFHAFPDKDAAFCETHRVLKKGGIFCGCFYVSNEFRRTDFFVEKLYAPSGFFTPPFETEESLRERLSGMYEDVSVSSVEGIGCFRAKKET